MKIYTTTYYDRFRCIAGDCPDSCCKEWDVLVDPASAAKYRALPGELGDRLRRVLKESEDGCTYMEIEDRRCPMWRRDGLCRIQAELGEEGLCQVCREFPRLRHDYGDFAELGLELSCPEAAKLIFADRDFNLVLREIPGGEPAEYDTQLMQILRQTRETALSIVRDSCYSVNQMLTQLLIFGYEAQEQIDGGKPVEFDPVSALNDGFRFADQANPEAFLQFFAGLEILTPEWSQMLRCPTPSPHWPEELRAIAGYMVLRYWLQAVSDYDLVSRVKLIVASCLAVHLVGGDIPRAAQLYSKEIENSAENVDAILDAAYAHPALTDQALLSLLQ